MHQTQVLEWSMHWKCADALDSTMEMYEGECTNTCRHWEGNWHNIGTHIWMAHGFVVCFYTCTYAGACTWCNGLQDQWDSANALMQMQINQVLYVYMLAKQGCQNMRLFANQGVRHQMYVCTHRICSACAATSHHIGFVIKSGFCMMLLLSDWWCNGTWAVRAMLDWHVECMFEAQTHISVCRCAYMTWAMLPTCIMYLMYKAVIYCSGDAIYTCSIRPCCECEPLIVTMMFSMIC